MKKMYSILKNIFFSIEKQDLLKFSWIILVISIVGMNNSKAQVIVGTTSSTSVLSFGTTVTMAHTVSAGANRLLLVGVTHNRAGVVTGITYNGIAMDLVGSVVNSAGSDRGYVDIYSMENPPLGTFNVVVTFNSADNRGMTVGATTFYNVDQNNPLNSFASAQGASGTGNTTSNTVTLSGIPSSSNSLVYSVLSSRDYTITGFGAGQTALWNIDSAPTTNDRNSGAGSYKTASVPTSSVSYTRGGGSQNRHWVIGAVSINPIFQADLQVSKTVNNSTPYKGQTITFTITAQNNGPDNAPLVEVVDVLPAGYTFTSATPSVGLYNAMTGVWDIGTLNASTSATLSIQAIVNDAGPYLNTATISGNVVDNISGNNSSQATITICNAGATRPLVNN